MKKIFALFTLALVSITAFGQFLDGRDDIRVWNPTPNFATQKFEDGVYANPYTGYINKRASVKKLYRHFWCRTYTDNIILAENDMYLELIGETPHYHLISEYMESVRKCKWCKKIFETALQDAKVQAKKHDEFYACKKAYEESARREEEERQKRIDEERMENAKRLLAEQENEKLLIKKADSLRVVFIKDKSFREETIKTLEDALAVIQVCKRQLDANSRQRFAEVDALERQYTGRLVGEVFITKKNALNEKWEERNEKVMEKFKKSEETVKKMKMDAIKHFNDFLSENGVNVLYGSFYANYNGKIIDELVNGNNDKLDEAYERLFDKPKYVTKRNRKNYETTNYIIK